MSKAHTPQRWYAPWRQPCVRQVQDDPADLGTAFGLDLSMMMDEPAPVVHRAGWLRRLAQRRTPAA